MEHQKKINTPHIAGNISIMDPLPSETYDVPIILNSNSTVPASTRNIQTSVPASQRQSFQHPTNSKKCNIALKISQGIPIILALVFIIFGWSAFCFSVGGMQT